MRYLLVIITIFICCCIELIGQDIIKPNIYSKGLNIQNPASEPAHGESYNSIDLYGKYKFIDSDAWHKDINAIVNYIGRSRGVNGFYMASYSYDNYSYFNRHILSAGYGKGWLISGNSFISVGMRGVFNIDNIRWFELYNANTETHNRNTYITPDIDIGVEYKLKNTRIGLSVRNIAGIKRKIQDSGVILVNRRQFFFDVAHRFSISEALEIESHLSSYIERNITADIGLDLTYGKRYTFLYNFRIIELRHIAGFLIDDIIKGVNFGVVYDISHLHRDHNLDFVIGVRF